MAASDDGHDRPGPPAPDATWGPVELELNHVALVHSERLRRVHEAGAELADRVRDAINRDHLDPAHVAAVTGLELEVVQEIARVVPPEGGTGRFLRGDARLT